MSETQPETETRRISKIDMKSRCGVEIGLGLDMIYYLGEYAYIIYQDNFAGLKMVKNKRIHYIFYIFIKNHEILI